MAITQVGFTGSVNAAGYAKASRFHGARVGTVALKDDFAVTIPGGSLSVNIAPGTAFAHGVSVTSTAVEARSLDAVPTSGQSRWDAIVLRRDWTTSTITLMKINGIAAAAAPMAVPAGVQENPGTVHDQVLALVQVTNGSAAPTAVVPFVGVAVSSTVLTLPSEAALPTPSAALYGTECVIAGTTLRFRCDSISGTPSWVKTSKGPASNLLICSTAMTPAATNADVVGLSDTVSIDYTTDVVLVTVVLDVQVTTAGSGSAVGVLLVDGVEVTTQGSPNYQQVIVREPTVGIRATASQNYRLTGLTPGNHAIKVQARQVSTGAASVNSYHSTMTWLKHG